MPLSRRQRHELFGALLGVVVAYSGVIIAAAFGYVRFGLLTLTLTVPAGVITGYALVRLLEFASRVLSD